jgi:hypothetical protein
MQLPRATRLFIRINGEQHYLWCSVAIWTGKSVNQDWKVQSRQMMIDAARQESKSFLIPSRAVKMEW